LRVEFLKPTSYKAKVYGTGEVGNINDADYNRLFKRGSVRMLQMGKVEPEKPVETPNKKVEQEKKKAESDEKAKIVVDNEIKKYIETGKFFTGFVRESILDDYAKGYGVDVSSCKTKDEKLIAVANAIKELEGKDDGS